jgi:hypothetical protein
MAIHFDNDKDQGIYDYTTKLGQPAVAVFDIGTHGARILAAPQVVPSKWPAGTFRLVGDEFSLGASVDPRTDVLELNNPIFQRLLNWIKVRRKTLEKCGVDEISIIGTAVFRWLDNKEEVVAKFKSVTGLNLEIIPEYREAELTFLSLPVVLHVGDRTLGLRDEDIVMLFDQGGGSTEISWMRWGDRNVPRPTPDLRLYDELGTVALRSQFFERNASGDFVKPEDNVAGIDAQFARVQSHVQRVASAWRGGPKKRPDNTIHVFGMGSALSKIVSGKAPDKHLRRLERSFLEEKLAQSFQDLNAIAGDDKQVRSLRRRQRALENDNSKEGRKTREKLDDTLVKLYGLPAIIGLLDRCRVDQIHFSSYGLAYGYYVDKYRESSRPAPEIYTGKEPYVFVSYCHADQTIAHRVIRELQARGFRVWYDQGLVGGDDWQDVVANKIAGCEAFVLLMSPDANLSENVLTEFKYAKRKHDEKQIKALINFVVRPTQVRPEISMRLGDDIHIAWSAVDHEYLHKLERALPGACR